MILSLFFQVNNGNFFADTNNDGDVSLQEIYYYAKNQVLYSNVQVYPTNENFIIGPKYKENSMANIEFWDTFYNIPVNKSWNIKFNQKLDDFFLEKQYIYFRF